MLFWFTGQQGLGSPLLASAKFLIYLLIPKTIATRTAVIWILNKITLTV